MTRLPITLSVLLAALVAPSEALASGGEVVRPQSEIDRVSEAPPPAGSAADMALWRAGREVTEAITIERGKAGTLTVAVGSNKLLEKLEEAAGKAGPAEAASIKAVRARLEKAWQHDYAVLSRQWPVDPVRGCGYPHLAFDSAMRMAPGTDDGTLDLARTDLKACVAKARGAVQAVIEANQELEAARAAAVKALGPRAPAGTGRT